MANSHPKYRNAVKIYHGFGHTHSLTLFGHVFKSLPAPRSRYSNNVFVNIRQILKLFFVKPLPGIRVELEAAGQIEKSETAEDGFFRFEWESKQHLPAGWHTVSVKSIDQNEQVTATAEGRIFVPHTTQFTFISDIDDTVMVSHSGTIRRRLRELFIRNPHTRTMFPDVALHYELLSAAHTIPDAPNPFFYVSSSEWNLYDYLVDFFNHNKLPEGAFLLNQVKRWYELWKTGKTKHEGKLLRIVRILDAFPKQRFVFFGDNSQADPEIYNKITERFHDRVHAIYIRSVNRKREPATKRTLAIAESRGVHCCLFRSSREAIAHSKAIGLIEPQQSMPANFFT